MGILALKSGKTNNNLGTQTNACINVAFEK